MARRLTLLVVLLFVLPATAYAASVKVRIEGKTKTLFAPTYVTVNASNALDALEQAATIGEIYYHVTSSSFGNYVDQIGLYGGTASSGWVFKVDNASPPVGADQVQLKDGDTVLWYYATFGPTGGPPTLEIKPAPGGCYLVAALDDNGKSAAVTNLQWHVGSKSTVPGAIGKPFCPKKHTGLLIRATADNAVRSNALR